MRLRVAPLSAVLLCAAASAQQPQVNVHVDLWPTMRTGRDGESIFRWYTDRGIYSTVSLTVLTEVGFRVFVSERLQRIDNDVDNELFNEYYIEDTGHWRFGKQLLPFGRAVLEHEYVRAARVDTNLAVGGWPVALAWCDGGTAAEQGVVARVGGNIGASIASGSHFGIAGSAFNDVRKPEDSPGLGAGYQLMLGADTLQRMGRTTVTGEWVRVRNGHTPSDVDNDFGLVDVTYLVEGKQKASLAWVREFAGRTDSFRLRAVMTVSDNLELLPQVRWRGGRLFETSIALHYKL